MLVRIVDRAARRLPAVLVLGVLGCLVATSFLPWFGVSTVLLLNSDGWLEPGAHTADVWSGSSWWIGTVLLAGVAALLATFAGWLHPRRVERAGLASLALVALAIGLWVRQWWLIEFATKQRSGTSMAIDTYEILRPSGSVSIRSVGPRPSDLGGFTGFHLHRDQLAAYAGEGTTFAPAGQQLASYLGLALLVLLAGTLLMRFALLLPGQTALVDGLTEAGPSGSGSGAPEAGSAEPEPPGGDTR